MIAMITREPDANAAPTEENTESELAKYMSRKNLFKSIEAAYTVLLDLELMVQDELRLVFIIVIIGETVRTLFQGLLRLSPK